MWKRLSHPYIVPFVGVTMDPLQIVTKWMLNGTLTEFIEENPGADRITLVRRSLQLRSTDSVTPPSYWT